MHESALIKKLPDLQAVPACRQSLGFTETVDRLFCTIKERKKGTG
ncbi:hypothetical protein DB29_04129 [Shouchella clausii]|nr:hypothetical protein DB29_04129 [Shouchella clausii]